MNAQIDTGKDNVVYSNETTIKDSFNKLSLKISKAKFIITYIEGTNEAL